MKVQEKVPLVWPSGWARAKTRNFSKFEKRSNSAALDFVIAELERMGASEVVISGNGFLRGEPGDPGVAVYFTWRGQRRVLACDRWMKVAENVWAIGKHIEALRGQQRWGVGSMEQAFAGYTALPERTGDRTWWAVLGVKEGATKAEIEEAFRSKAKAAHPDTGGSHESFLELKNALEMGLRARGN